MVDPPFARSAPEVGKALPPPLKLWRAGWRTGGFVGERVLTTDVTDFHGWGLLGINMFRFSKMAGNDLH